MKPDIMLNLQMLTAFCLFSFECDTGFIYYKRLYNIVIFLRRNNHWWKKINSRINFIRVLAVIKKILIILYFTLKSYIFGLPF